ncbi:MAG TPA: diiron oxygenase [Blastocatellia bacterium]|nr:diiron oxygenase [Blastocatellia bacterium]
MTAISKTVKRLSEVSIKDYINPYSHLSWPDRLDESEWLTSPELISVRGTSWYETLSEEAKKRLSFYEAVNFFSLNIHGEKSLIEGLAARLYKRGNDEISPYLHHFLDEENKHMVYFGTFCTKYAGKVYPDKKLVFPREHAPGEEDFLFFARVMVFEEIVDVYNVTMARDERLSSIARQINLLHHRDEARHLVFGRLIVKELFARHAPAWSPETLAGVRDYLKSYFMATWKEYYNPAVYRDAGCESAYELMEEAFQLESSREHRKRVSNGCVEFLIESGILDEEPSL